jgi:hypothetical protein
VGLRWLLLLGFVAMIIAQRPLIDAESSLGRCLEKKWCDSALGKGGYAEVATETGAWPNRNPDKIVEPFGHNLDMIDW